MLRIDREVSNAINTFGDVIQQINIVQASIRVLEASGKQLESLYEAADDASDSDMRDMLLDQINVIRDSTAPLLNEVDSAVVAAHKDLYRDYWLEACDFSLQAEVLFSDAVDAVDAAIKVIKDLQDVI